MGSISPEKVRLGFIGAGWWATANHMPLLKPRGDVEFVGVCRLGSDILQKVKEEFGFTYATEDYRELLNQPLDAVVVSSPHRFHYEHARAALECGLHVMCEKPMTLSAAEAWDLVEVARQKNVHLLIPYGWHYKPFLQHAKRLMNDNVVGQVQYVLCHMASPTKDFFSGGGSVPAQWEPTLAKPDSTTWQVKAYGGGYAHGQITHSSALMFWLTGLRAAEVSALMTAPDSQVDMYDAATVRFENGAIGTISGAATLPDNDKFQVDVRIFGSDGALLLDVERERVELRRHDGKHQHLEIQPGEGSYSCEGPPQRFIDLIQGQGTNDSAGEVAARSVELIEAMHRSAEAGGQATKV